jgi:hypothetical protein
VFAKPLETGIISELPVLPHMPKKARTLN